MPVTLGEGDFRYEVVEGWEQLPPGVSLRETPGVAVNERDEVFLLTRNTDHPVMALDRDGRFLRSFGAGVFDARTHGLFLGADGALWCVDDGTHAITKWSQEGELLLTIGGQPAPRWSGQPFNRPTHAAVSPVSGDLFITDGYGNARVHRYTADGEHVRSWGGPGIDAGQFIRPPQRGHRRGGARLRGRTASATACRCSTARAASSRCGTTSTAPTAWRSAPTATSTWAS